MHRRPSILSATIPDDQLNSHSRTTHAVSTDGTFRGRTRSGSSLASGISPIEKPYSTLDLYSPSGSSGSTTFSTSPKKIHRISSLELFNDHPHSETYVNVISFDHIQDIEGVQKLREYSTHLTPDFLNRMEVLADGHNVLISCRLQNKPDRPSNRRYSLLSSAGQIVAAPKEPAISTTSNPSDTLCTGHLPRYFCFQENQYRPEDSNYSGAFPKDVKKASLALQLYLQENLGQNIQIVNKFENLICFAESVRKTDSEYHLKHYIQEAERLCSIVDRIERDIYIFIKVDQGELYFKTKSGVLCKLNLKHLMPNRCLNALPINTKIFSDFVLYAENEDILLQHAPIWYLLNDHFVPVMVQAGANGFHIAPDADPQHIGIRNDMPWIVYNTYVGHKDDSTLFINDLTKLLENPNTPYFHSLPYYRHVFTPLAQNTLEFYIEHPYLLSKVGTCSIHQLVMLRGIDHPLAIHGTEDLHPSTIPSNFGVIIICYKGSFFVTADERSYIAFLMHDRDILREQHIGTHPYWLRDRPPGLNLTEQWLDVLEVQAIYESQQPGRLENYQDALLKQFNRGRAGERSAMHKLCLRVTNIVSMQDKEERIKHIYDKYADSTVYINSLIVPQKRSMPRLTL